MDRAEQEALYRRIGLGQRDVGGDPASLAVVVVDFQRLFTEGELSTPRTPDALAATATLLERARACAVPVFFVHVVYDEPSDAGPVWSAKSPAMGSALRDTPQSRSTRASSPVRTSACSRRNGHPRSLAPRFTRSSRSSG